MKHTALIPLILTALITITLGCSQNPPWTQADADRLYIENAIKEANTTTNAKEAVWIIFDAMQLLFDAPNYDDACECLDKLLEDNPEIEVPRLR